MPDGDYRPFTVPLPECIKGWWCSGSGENRDGEYATICAVMDSGDEDTAKAIIRDFWNPCGWRFCNERDPDWMPDSWRFPQ